MRIKKIKLKNFKFHNHLEFDFLKNKDKNEYFQNCLIYGENGSGKSSIYEALYSIFKTYFRNNKFNSQKFQKNNSSESLTVEVMVENEIIKIPNEQYILPETISLDNRKTIYFANQYLFDYIISDSNDFYITIMKTLKKYFSTLDDFYQGYEDINKTIDNENYSTKIEYKQSIDYEFKGFLEKIKNKANDIILVFGENFKITFEFEQGATLGDIGDFRFDNPKITLKIDNQESLGLYFNEAKLKLTSIAIFFALIKLEEDKTNSLKLLVLDDFLTSLDMANRHYIIEYIFKNFKKYQIILFTHNLQFYNLILDWLNTNNQSNKWDIKNIYVRNSEGGEESIIYNHNSDYLIEAQKKLDESDELQACGNLIRKEFERIIHELEKLYKIGKKEQTSTIVDLIIGDKPIYANQHELLDTILPKIKDCKNKSNNMEKNKEDIKTILNSINTIQPSHNDDLKKILKKLIFYRKIVLNKASHNNPDAEIYRKEYQNSLRVIEELNILLDDLKKSKK